MVIILKAAINIDNAEDGVGFADASASVDQVGKTGSNIQYRRCILCNKC